MRLVKKVNRDGGVIIPHRVREELRIRPGDEIVLDVDWKNKTITIRKVAKEEASLLETDDFASGPDPDPDPYSPY